MQTVTRTAFSTAKTMSDALAEVSTSAGTVKTLSIELERDGAAGPIKIVYTERRSARADRDHRYTQSEMDAYMHERLTQRAEKLRLILANVERRLADYAKRLSV